MQFKWIIIKTISLNKFFDPSTAAASTFFTLQQQAQDKPDLEKAKKLGQKFQFGGAQSCLKCARIGPVYHLVKSTKNSCQ